MAEIRSLTALRGLAASWIVLHHFWPNTSAPTPFVIAKGYLAVDLFFILSGAVLYLVYAGEMRSGRFSFTRFAWRRVARLYPVHLVTLAAAMVILQGGAALDVAGRPLPYDLGEMAVLHLSLLHAWGITPTGGLNYPSWSLSAEAFAYLLFPLLAPVVLRLRPGTALALSTAFVLGFAVLLQAVWPVEWRPAAGVLVLTRMENDFGALRILPEFCLGLSIAAAAEAGVPLRRGAGWGVVGIALTVGGLAAGADLAVVAGFAAIIFSCLGTRLSAPALLRGLGQVSYSLYMSHALVQIVGFKLVEILGGYADRAVPPVFLALLLPITLICAILLYLLVERPARRRLLHLAGTGFARSKPRRSRAR